MNYESALNTIRENADYLRVFNGRISKAPVEINTIWVDQFSFDIAIYALTTSAKKPLHKELTISIAENIAEKRKTMVTA